MLQERGEDLCLATAVSDSTCVRFFDSDVLCTFGITQVVLELAMLGDEIFILGLVEFLEDRDKFVQFVDDGNDLRKMRKRFNLIGFESGHRVIFALCVKSFKTSLTKKYQRQNSPNIK